MKYPKTPSHSNSRCDITLKLKAKIKLHGTHASIFTSSDGAIIPQKRSTEFGQNSGDHFGFELFVKNFEGLTPSNSIIFGEWCGPKIQKEVACSQLKVKSFFIYGIAIDGFYYTNPDYIEAMLPRLPENAYILPWFDNKEYTISDISELERLVDDIDKEDPYIKSVFGISGVGEGLVLINPEPFILTENCLLYASFKVKGSSHDKSKKIVRYKEKPAFPKILDKLVESDFEKALEASNTIKGDLKNISAYLKEVVNDFIIENENELQDYDIKNVKKHLAYLAKMWFQS